MRYRQLGSSDLQVSEIALGSWLTYGVGVDAENAARCIHRALDLGINFIDTANIYGRGAAESFLGAVLAGVPRDRYLIATKLFFPMTDSDRGLSRAQVEKQLDASLKRLRVDTIDLYQCHRADPDTPIEETMRALTDAVAAGKVRYLGFSEWPAAAIREALAVSGSAGFVASQPQYSLLWRQPEAEIIPLCRANGISQIVWSPLAQGVLTGKYRPDAPPPAGTRATSEAMGGFIDRWLPRRRAAAAPARRGGRADAQPIRPGLGAARAQCRRGDHRRQPAGASRGECRGVGRGGRSRAVRPGRAHSGRGAGAGALSAALDLPGSGA